MTIHDILRNRLLTRAGLSEAPPTKPKLANILPHATGTPSTSVIIPCHPFWATRTPQHCTDFKPEYIAHLTP